jgi:hypothetical protein
MTAKEKARELVEKYYGKVAICMNCVDVGNSKELDESALNDAKQCALICVDEIISACEYNHVESYNTDWWNEVKKEIEKL